MKKKINLYGEDLRKIGYVLIAENENSISRATYYRQRDKIDCSENMYADIELNVYDRYDGVCETIPCVEEANKQSNYKFNVTNML